MNFVMSLSDANPDSSCLHAVVDQLLAVCWCCLVAAGLWLLQVNGLTVGAPACNPAANKQQQQCSASHSSSSSSGVSAEVSGGNPGVFATKAIKAGQLLAVVPLELALPVNTDNLLVSVVDFDFDCCESVSESVSECVSECKWGSASE